MLIEKQLMVDLTKLKQFEELLPQLQPVVPVISVWIQQLELRLPEEPQQKIDNMVATIPNNTFVKFLLIIIM
jgi:hypothetical protein